MVAYYDRRPLYRSRVGESRCFCDVLPQQLTLLDDPKFYWHLTTWVPVSHQTLFEEVTIVPPSAAWSPAEAELAHAHIEQQQVSLEQFAGIYFQAMQDAIVRAWDSERFHLVLHSAGWDTRMMSMALYALYQERGDRWLGNVVFVECANEADTARQVIQTIGWDDSLFRVYGDHEAGLNFATAWQHMDGGMRAYPFNMWWEVPQWAGAPGDAQCWSAFSGNNAVNSAIQNKLKWSFRTMPEAALSALPLRNDWIFPFVDLEFMRTLAEWGKGQRPGWCTADVVRTLSPSVGVIENPSGVRPVEISDAIFERAVADYQASWYGQLRPDVLPVQRLDYDRWWGHWGLASLCEELLAGGYEIDQ